MPSRPPVHRIPGARTEADRKRDHDRKRGSSAARGYSYKWQVARAAFLARAENVLCRYCKREGRIVQATVVDHIQPHRGNQTLMWDEQNWQPLCKPCHDGVKKSEEMTGRSKGCDVHGNPIGADHPWNRGRR